MNSEDLIRRLREAASAYPEDVFPKTTDHDREHHPNVVTRASAGMGRHFSPLFTAAADALESRPPLPANVAEALERLTPRLRNHSEYGEPTYLGLCKPEVADIRTILEYMKKRP